MPITVVSSAQDYGKSKSSGKFVRVVDIVACTCLAAVQTKELPNRQKMSFPAQKDGGIEWVIKDTPKPYIIKLLRVATRFVCKESFDIFPSFEYEIMNMATKLNGDNPVIFKLQGRSVIQSNTRGNRLWPDCLWATHMSSPVAELEYHSFDTR